MALQHFDQMDSNHDGQVTPRGAPRRPRDDDQEDAYAGRRLTPFRLGQ